jgi:HEAT repeat protein
MLEKANPAAPSSVSANRPTRRAWIYGLSAAAVLVLALGVVGAVVGSPSWWQKDKAVVLALTQDESADQVAEESEELGSTIVLDCCKGNPTTADEKKSEETAEQPVAKLSVEKKGQDLANDLAKPVKPAGKPEVVDKAKSETEAQIVVKRRQKKSEEELRKELAWVPEIGLGATASGVLVNWSIHINSSINHISPQEVHLIGLATVSPIVTNRPDLGGLPFRQGKASQLRTSEAKTLGELSRKLRLYLAAAAPLDEEGHRPKDLTLLRETVRLEMRDKRPEWLRYEAVPAMTQLLMHEDTPLRLLLVDMLAQIPEKQATVALAQRAVFDLAPDVRDAALTVLKERKIDDYLPFLLKTLRYPFAAFSDQAAEALVALNLRRPEAISDMVVMLGEQDPLAPYVIHNKGGFQKELVRANHLTNCLLCHPPSITGNDSGAIGVDPILTIGSGGSSTGTTSTAGAHEYSGASSSGPLRSLLIRGDTTFIKQDLSVIQPELRAGTTLPTQLRFDYFVRTKWLPEKKASELRTQQNEQATYAQRESVLFALRELTGQDPGPTTEAWLKLFPRAELDVEAAKYRDKLVDAVAKKRGDAVLTTLKDGEGVVYTVALADAIPKLPKDFRDKARQALAERMSRMTADTLRNKFQEDDVEIRRAAVQASVIKGDSSLVSDLSELLEDPNPAVAGLADDAIKALSKSKKKQKSDQPSDALSSAK